MLSSWVVAGWVGADVLSRYEYGSEVWIGSEGLEW